MTTLLILQRCRKPSSRGDRKFLCMEHTRPATVSLSAHSKRSLIKTSLKTFVFLLFSLLIHLSFVNHKKPTSCKETCRYVFDEMNFWPAIHRSYKTELIEMVIENGKDQNQKQKNKSDRIKEIKQRKKESRKIKRKNR